MYLPMKMSEAPHIDPYYGKNQTVQMGETVSVNCKIYNVANRFRNILFDLEMFTESGRWYLSVCCCQCQH